MTRDWSNKKISKLPPSIFNKMELETLILKASNIRDIQDEISNLINLKELDLSETKLKSLPDSIGQLKNLEILKLSRCYELESLPTSIGLLKNLRKLDISYFPGKVPNTITQLQELEELDASGICGEIQPEKFPDWIHNLKGLKKLNISKNSFVNLPKEISLLSQLNYLNLSDSLGYLKSIPNLSKLKNLKRLECNGGGLDEYPKQEILKYFFQIKSLEFLRIDSFKSEEKWLSEHELEEYKKKFKNDPTELTDFESRLRVNDSNHYYLNQRRKMCSADFNGISKLMNLRELSIRFNNLQEFPNEIFELKKLEKAHIYGNDFQKKEITALKKFKTKTEIIAVFN